jgi:ATP-dependent RNA circularization protein (DNA/RNA ligase family)
MKNQEHDTFIVCSRNYAMNRKEKDGKRHWEMADKYKIEERMKKFGKNLAIQGEICGPGIGGNKLNLSEIDLFVFNIWDIDDHHYLSWDDVVKITDEMKLKRVPEIYKGKFKPEWKDPAALMELAEAQEYSPGIPAEGIVVKNNYDKSRPRHSFKIISNKFLLFNTPKKDKPKKEKTKKEE